MTTIVIATKEEFVDVPGKYCVQPALVALRDNRGLYTIIKSRYTERPKHRVQKATLLRHIKKTLEA